jgi:hypothetical protein
MRLGYFVASYGGIFVVLGLAMPMPTRFQVAAGGNDPVPESAPRCFALAYAQTPSEDFPAHVRLEWPIVYKWNLPVPDSNWYRIVAEPSRVETGWWHVAGPDSVDFVAWHHGPLFRIPVRGGQGHGVFRGAPSFVAAMVEPAIPVGVIPEACDESINAVPGV